MKIAVSACLLGINCKYNGGNNYSKKVAALACDNEIIPVCPEVLGGLPTPRDPSEIADGVVKHKNGESVDDEFQKGAAAALDIVKKNHVELVVLQSRSPSCGIKEVYDGTFSKRLIPGEGVFAKLLRENNIRTVDVSDL